MAHKPKPPEVLWSDTTGTTAHIYWGGYVSLFELRHGRFGSYAYKISRGTTGLRMPKQTFEDARKMALQAMLAPEAERDENRLRMKGLLSDQLVEDYCKVVNKHVRPFGGKITSGNVWDTVNDALGKPQKGIVRAVAHALLKQQRRVADEEREARKTGERIATERAVEAARQGSLPLLQSGSTSR